MLCRYEYSKIKIKFIGNETFTQIRHGQNINFFLIVTNMPSRYIYLYSKCIIDKTSAIRK